MVQWESSMKQRHTSCEGEGWKGKKNIENCQFSYHFNPALLSHCFVLDFIILVLLFFLVCQTEDCCRVCASRKSSSRSLHNSVSTQYICVLFCSKKSSKSSS